MKLTKWFLYFFLFVLNCATIQAQKNHFIYIQTDNKQPFYAKLDKKIYSSSTSGYVILPKLINGDYTFTFGFPKNEWPEQKVMFHVNDNDAGYLFKNFGDKGWGFYNLQTSQIVMANVIKEEAVVVTPTPPEKITTPVIEQKEPTPAITKVEKTPEEVKIIAPEIKEEKKNVAKELIEQRQYKNSDAGVDIVYTIIKTDKTTETVKIFIPVDKAEEDKKTLVVEKKEETPIVVETKKEEPPLKQETPFEVKKEIEQPIVKDEKNNEPKIDIKENKSTLTIPNSNCNSNATEDDYLKLRKKIVNAKSNEEMLFRAHESFKKTCYSTEQIRTLSYLFLTDEFKYKFFDTAYPFVFDSEKFVLLEKELKDTYYINRFKSMIHP